MRKNDSKPGVIYAYQRSRDSSPDPIVFLNAPAAGILYTEANPYGTSGKLAYSRARESAKPGRGSGGYGSRDTGYPAVMLDYNATCEPQDLLKLTLPEFEQATSSYATGVDGTRFTLITSLTHITGPYDEVLAVYAAQQDKERQQREQEKADRQVIIDRAHRIASRLEGYGVDATLDHYGCLKISLDDAEKLLVALNVSRH